MLLREVIGRVALLRGSRSQVSLQASSAEAGAGRGDETPERVHGGGEGEGGDGGSAVRRAARQPASDPGEVHAHARATGNAVWNQTLSAAWDLIDAATEEATTEALTELIRLGGPSGRHSVKEGKDGWLTPHKVLLVHHKQQGEGSAVSRVVELLDPDTPMACHANAAAAVTNLTVDRELCAAIAARGAMERLALLIKGSSQPEVLERAAKAARNLGWEAPDQKRVAIETGTAKRVVELVHGVLDKAPEGPEEASKEDLTLLKCMTELLWNVVSGFSAQVTADGGVEMLQRLIFWATGCYATRKLLASAIHCMHVLCHGEPDLVRLCALEGGNGRKLSDTLVAIVEEGRDVHGEGVVIASSAMLRTVGLDAPDRLAKEFYWPYAKLVLLAARAEAPEPKPLCFPVAALKGGPCVSWGMKRRCFRTGSTNGCGAPPKDGYDLAWFARNLPEGLVCKLAACVSNIDAATLSVPEGHTRRAILQRALRTYP